MRASSICPRWKCNFIYLRVSKGIFYVSFSIFLRVVSFSSTKMDFSQLIKPDDNSVKKILVKKFWTFTEGVVL